MSAAELPKVRSSPPVCSIVRTPRSNDSMAQAMVAPMLTVSMPRVSHNAAASMMTGRSWILHRGPRA